MSRADENLRVGAAAVGAFDHLLAYVPVTGGIDLMETDALAGQEFLGVRAIGAIQNGIDVDRGHDGTKILSPGVY